MSFWLLQSVYITKNLVKSNQANRPEDSRASEMMVLNLHGGQTVSFDFGSACKDFVKMWKSRRK